MNTDSYHMYVNSPMIVQGPVSQKKLKSKNLSLKKMLSLENK